MSGLPVGLPAFLPRLVRTMLAGFSPDREKGLEGRLTRGWDGFLPGCADFTYPSQPAIGEQC